MNEKDDGQLEFWAILELFGHTKIAGFVRQVSLGGDAMLRVDVPELKYRRRVYGVYPEQPKDGEEVTIQAFTKFYSPKAVFAMTPVSEETAKAAMQSFRTEPVQTFEITRPLLPAPDYDGGANDETSDERQESLGF